MKYDAADRKWSRAVRERDAYTCQRCGAVHAPNSQGLHGAHIFGRGKLAVRHDVENGIALCYGCHRFIDGHKEEKELLARALLGDERYEALELRSRRLKKDVA